MPFIRKKEFEAMRIAGVKMSNWLYNQRQQDYFAAYKEDMKAMVDEWDAARQRAEP
jgi:hypothetical protein